MRTVSSAELLQRRNEILAHLGVGDAASVAQLAREGQLVDDQWDAWERLQDIAYLLEEPATA